jgi:hypothetical protein
MTHDQLAKVFPNGRTLHLPSDGNPLPGYELAQSDAERGVSRPAERKPQRSLLAALFSGAQDIEESADNTSVAATSRPAAASAARRPAPPAPAVEASVAAVPLPPTRPTFQVASATERLVPAPAPAPRPTNWAALSPNQIIGERGYWQGPQDVPAEFAVSAKRRAGSQTASADLDATASLGAFGRKDRVPTEVALAYAAETGTVGLNTTRPAIVTTQGTASVAAKPAEAQLPTNVRAVNAAERLDDPWLRGVMIAPNVQTSLTTTLFGAPDFRTLRTFMQKPASTVMMTFNGDPHLGVTTEAFTGSAVVFQPTVTFNLRTAMLPQ